MPDTALPMPVNCCAPGRDITTNWLSYWNIPVLKMPVTSYCQSFGTAIPSAAFTFGGLGGIRVTTSPTWIPNRSASRSPRISPPSTEGFVVWKRRSPRTIFCGSVVTAIEPVSASNPRMFTASA